MKDTVILQHLEHFEFMKILFFGGGRVSDFYPMIHIYNTATFQKNLWCKFVLLLYKMQNE